MNSERGTRGKASNVHPENLKDFRIFNNLEMRENEYNIDTMF